MILLVIGLVAVIVVVLIAVFLSIRLGRGDEDDEPELRPGRDRRRDQDERWRERDTRRVPSSARGAAPRGRGDDGYALRGPRGGGAGTRSERGRGYGDAPRRPSRPDAPGYRRQPARAAAAASGSSLGRYDAPPRRHADDFPSADYPSMDLGPAEAYPADGHPSGEFPAVGHGGMDGPRDSRRKAGAAPATSKSRSRQRGKRDDDDDWPSSDWDKLSDEQYWAELSADKPLSSMARPAAKAARDAAAAAPVNGAAKPAARDSRPARPSAPARDLPGRRDHAEREPATERLPVRAAAYQAPPPPAPARLDTSAAVAGRSYPEPRTPLDSAPRAARDTGPHRTMDTGPHQLRDTGPRAVRDTGPLPRADHRRWDTTGPHAALGSTPPPIPGALEDDPLTSPSFSLKSVPSSDSRSYSNARKHAKPVDEPGTGAHANGSAIGNGNGYAGYPAADPGYAYQSAPPPAGPGPAPTADWYSAPPAAEPQAPVYGNPYQYSAAANGSSAGFADVQATAGYPGYLADPLRVYSPPSYAGPAPVPYAEPAAPAPYQAVPNGATMPYADGYSGHPYAEQAGYPDGYQAAGPLAPGYEDTYRTDPYAAGGYGPYPPRG
jgi:hypothetical protein